MEWLEITVNAHDGDTETLVAVLEGLGVSGLVIEDEKDVAEFAAENRAFWDEVDEAFLCSRKGISRIKFYLEDNEAGQTELSRLREALRDYPLFVAGMRDEDWENNWKQYYKPIAVGQKLLIVPEWETVPETEGRTVLRLDPGLTFGTGAHPSTRMCLEAMEDHAPAAKRVLDLGCGSGILAIAALCLGAGEALGCDIDEKAPRIAMENAALNGVQSRLRVLAGDASSDAALRSQMGKNCYDIVFLNIVADVIIALSRDVPHWLKAGGRLFVSGVIDGREQEVEQALLSAGFTVLQHKRMEDWHSFTCTAGGDF